MKIYQTIIVGGGPSGISCSYHLKQNNIEHLILEKNEMLHTWRNERWDSFYLVTPNWMTNLPGVDHLIPYDNAFMSKSEIENVLLEYLYHVKPNFVENTYITDIEKKENHYILNTNNGSFACEHLIVATGMFNQPFVPSISKDLPKTIKQMHSREYLNPSQLTEGNTLVVGSGRSGIQIALEVKEALKKEVYLSVGSVTPLPTIYRSINGVYWLNKLSGFTKGKETLPYVESDFANDNIKNKISQTLYHCQVAGVEILGRMMGVDHQDIQFSDDLIQMLEDGKSYLEKIETRINEIIKKENLDLNDVHFDFKDIDQEKLSGVTKINKQEIHNIIWCTGFKPNYEWLTLDIFNEDGSLNLKDGVSTFENVHFCGLELKPSPSTKSSFGVGLFALVESAERAVKAVVENIKG